MPPHAQPIVIATRGSELARAQANLVRAQCEAAFPGQPFELRVVKTTGDKLQAESSAEVDLPKGLFTKELEVALLNKEADLAVHSLKDLPTELPEGLELGAVTARADVRDVIVHRNPIAPSSLADLPPGFTIATSSPRRKAQLVCRRCDLSIVPIRGNVPTRLKKLATQPDLGALILALAGFHRLGYTLNHDGTLTGSGVPSGLAAFILSLEDMLPCVGQGALGIEIRANDQRAKGICAALNDPATRRCALAERAFLRATGGGCKAPVAAYAKEAGDKIRLRAVSFEGELPRRFDDTRSSDAYEELGRAAALALKRIS